MSSELRWDALAGAWVGIAGARQDRPNLPTTDECPFCVGGIEAPAAYEVKAFANRWPMFTPGDPTMLEPVRRRVPARGAAEIVLYAPEHDASLASLGAARVRKVVDLWAERTQALLQRPEVEYVLVFENRGADAGATIPHPHGQIYAFPFVPPVPAREAEVAARDGCALCAEDPGGRVVSARGGWRAYVPYASHFRTGSCSRRTSTSRRSRSSTTAAATRSRSCSSTRSAASTGSSTRRFRTCSGCTPACTCTCTWRRRDAPLRLSVTPQQGRSAAAR